MVIIKSRGTRRLSKESKNLQKGEKDEEDQGSHPRVRGPQQDQANLDEKAR